VPEVSRTEAHWKGSRSGDQSALANYVVNSDPEGINHNLEQRPLMAFVLCYVSAHLALDLLDAQQAERILNYCEAKLEEE
jgi:hypothetical protein